MPRVRGLKTVLVSEDELNAELLVQAADKRKRDELQRIEDRLLNIQEIDTPQDTSSLRLALITRRDELKGTRTLSLLKDIPKNPSLPNFPFFKDKSSLFASPSSALLAAPPSQASTVQPIGTHAPASQQPDSTREALWEEKRRKFLARLNPTSAPPAPAPAAVPAPVIPQHPAQTGPPASLVPKFTPSPRTPVGPTRAHAAVVGSPPSRGRAAPTGVSAGAASTAPSGPRAAAAADAAAVNATPASPAPTKMASTSLVQLGREEAEICERRRRMAEEQRRTLQTQIAEKRERDRKYREEQDKPDIPPWHPPVEAASPAFRAPAVEGGEAARTSFGRGSETSSRPESARFEAPAVRLAYDRRSEESGQQAPYYPSMQQHPVAAERRPEMAALEILAEQQTRMFEWQTSELRRRDDVLEKAISVLLANNTAHSAAAVPQSAAAVVPPLQPGRLVDFEQSLDGPSKFIDMAGRTFRGFPRSFTPVAASAPPSARAVPAAAVEAVVFTPAPSSARLAFVRPGRDTRRVPELTITKAGDPVSLAPIVSYETAAVPPVPATPTVRPRVTPAESRAVDLLQTLPMSKSVILSQRTDAAYAFLVADTRASLPVAEAKTALSIARETKAVMVPSGPEEDQELERLLEALDEVREMRKARDLVDPFESFCESESSEEIAEEFPELANITFEPLSVEEEFKFPEFTKALENAEALDENIREEVQRLVALVRGIRN